MRMIEADLDLNDAAKKVLAQLGQNDYGTYQFHFTVRDDKGIVQLGQYADIGVAFKRCDGKCGENRISDGSVLVEDFKIIYNVPPAFCAVDGDVTLEIRLYGEESRLTGLCKGIVNVIPDIRTDGCVMDDPDFPVLDGLIKSVAEMEKAAQIAEEGRNSAEAVRASNEEARAAAENTRCGAEDARQAAELSRLLAETARESAESARVAAENDRGSAEEGRKAAETERAADESQRDKAEALRQAAEAIRASAEDGREDAELIREAAEAGRGIAENERASGEAAREAAEAARQAAENERVSAEAARKSAESAREEAEAARAEELAKKADKIKAIPHTTASGYPISVSGHLEGESVMDYKIYGNSVQDGTPTTETPIEIQSTGGLVTDTSSEYYGKYDVPVTVCGKNFLHSSFGTKTTNGVTATYDNGTITLNGTCTAACLFELGEINLIAGTYTLTANSNQIPISNNNALVQLYDRTNVVPITLTNKNAYGCTTVATSVDGTFLYRVRAESGVVYDNVVLMPQLEVGTSSTAYEPYKGETKHIYLEEPIRKLGDYADYIDYENQKVVRQIEVVDDTGTKTIDKSFALLDTPKTEAITAPNLTVPNSEVMNISSGTVTPPSSMDVTYYQDINKVIAELKNAILSQGGNV